MTVLQLSLRAAIVAICISAASPGSVAFADSPGPGSESPGYAIEKDIHYGPHPKQVFDLYVAEPAARREPAAATIVFAHGGGYYLSDKADEEKYIMPLLSRGFDVINTNYRLGEGIFAATKDLSDLLRHLVDEGAQYGLASQRVVLMGFSSGGQMSANIGFWQNEADDPFGVPKTLDIAAVVNISGPSHSLLEVEQIFLNFDYQPFRELGAALFPAHPRYTKSQVISLVEPVNHFDEQDPPFFLWYGGQDVQIPPGTHERILEKMRANPTRHRVVYEPEGRHSPSESEFNRAYDELFRFLDSL